MHKKVEIFFGYAGIVGCNLNCYVWFADVIVDNRLTAAKAAYALGLCRRSAVQDTIHLTLCASAYVFLGGEVHQRHDDGLKFGDVEVPRTLTRPSSGVRCLDIREIHVAQGHGEWTITTRLLSHVHCPASNILHTLHAFIG